MASSSTGILALPYNYPVPGAWDPIGAAKKAHPGVPVVAVANQNSGNLLGADPNFAAAISSLQVAGVSVIGYINTDRGAASVASMVQTMQNYIAWYNVQGFFFDVLASTGQEAVLSQLQAFAKQYGGLLTIGNPGTPIPASYTGLLDNFVVFEGGPAGPPSIASGSSYVLYGQATYPAGFVSNAKQAGAKYVYVTSLPGPPQNPYAEISPYLSQLAAQLAS